MKTPLKSWCMWLLVTLLLVSCTAPAGPQPAAPLPPAGGGNGSSQASPRPTTPRKLPTPVLPVATPYATPRPQSGLFEDRELGLTVNYPFFWNRSSGAVPGTVVQLANQADNVFVLIIRTPLPADESLETAATDMHGRLGEWLGGLEALNSQASTVADGTVAWRSEYSLTYEGYGVTVQGFFLSVPHQRQLITLAAYGQSQHLTPERTTVDDILNSVKLQEPEVYGIPRSQAFVFQDFETGDPRYYDPATGPADRRVFGGLVGFNPQLALQPDLAESWDISADGTVYTFYLNPKAKFHDGRPVTAVDVVYSWERAADPKTRSHQAGTFLGDIVGFAEKQRGEADSISGLKVLDERTLGVTIDGPKPYFLMKLTWGPALVVDRANVESGPEWYRTPNGTGPYRLLRWEEDKARVYQRNENYHLEPATIPYLIGRLDAWNGLRMYELGELDHVALNSFQAAALRTSENPMRENLRESPSMCTSFVTFDTSRAPFDDPKVRQAFALAVDRQLYQERVLEGAGIPANGLYPPSLPGFNPALQRLPNAPALAKQRLAETKYASEQLPPITITTGGQGFYTNPAIGVLAQMWQETLGAQIKIEALEPGSYVETVQQGQGGNLFFWAWCGVYPDPEYFADALFHSKAEQNISRYRNADVDGLLERARVEADPAKRLTFYQEVETMLVNDAAAIFLTHEVSYTLLNPRITGMVETPFDVPMERYLRITP